MSSIEVHGWRELESGSRRLAGKIEDAAERRFLGVADDVGAAGRGAVPRVSGALAGSVSSELIDGKASVGIGSADVPYAGWIEFGGTRGRPYVPGGRYLYPIAIDAEPQLVAAGTDAAKDEIRRFQWQSPM